MTKITHEMVGDACQAAFGPSWSFAEAEMVRAALEAAAPAIRKAAMEEAVEAIFEPPTNTEWTTYQRGRAAGLLEARNAIRTLADKEGA